MPNTFRRPASPFVAAGHELRLQICTGAASPPDGDSWLHEIKHDGHRLVAIVDSAGRLSLISRNGYDRAALFALPFAGLVAHGRPMVLDGEIAVPDERGVTHIDALSEAIASRRPDRLAYFAFDLLHIDGTDLRRTPIEQRKMLLRDVLGEAGCERVMYVDHIVGRGAELFDKVRAIGAEGIVSKRLGSLYHGRETRDWLKTKYHEVGQFVITGFRELGDGRLEAVHVAALDRNGELLPAGQVQFGFAGKGLWGVLDQLRAGPAQRGIVPVHLRLVAQVKFFGRYKSGSIRDGVLLSMRGVASEERDDNLCPTSLE